jgi:hypothetical protein
MTTALVPIGDLERMAQAFAKSGMFGAKTPDQAMSLLLLAQAEGVHPAIAMRDFDVIQGRPAKKAEAMQRAFLAAGGTIEWHSMTDDLAEASFSHPQGSNGKPVKISWDIARAKKAGLGGKDNYTKFPRQMLCSRVISEGCRRVYPASTSGLYVPEEVRDFPKDKRAEKDMGNAVIVDDAQQEEPLKVSPEQIEAIQKTLKETGFELADFLAFAEITDIGELAATDGPKAVEWIKKQKPAKAA